MAYDKKNLVALRNHLLTLVEDIDDVIVEGDADEDAKSAQWEDYTYNPNWTYYGGTKTTGRLRRDSMTVTRALAEMRKP